MVRRRIVADDICSLELQAPDGRPLPAFAPGAHIDLHLSGDLVRQYSICSAPDQLATYRIAVLREPGSRGGSVAAHELVEGQVVRVSEPRNLFPLAEGASHHLLLAGGIGITPLLSMAQELHRRGASFDLHYCARSPSRAAFVDEMVTQMPGRVHLHFDDGADGQRLRLPAVLDASPPHTHLYACGPGGFIDAMLGGARQVGWSETRLHREYFAAPGAPENAPAGERFEVQIASTGKVIEVPAQRSVVDALKACGIEVPVSCEQGICGTCVLRVLEGQPDHRDMFLTPQERDANDRFTPCCSRSRTARLVLDL